MLGIGRYVEQKNFEGLIMAVKLLADEGRDVCAVLVGEGRLRGLYEEMIDKLDCAAAVALADTARTSGDSRGATSWSCRPFSRASETCISKPCTAGFRA